MKKCPYCAEQIQDEAIICRFCNRDLKESPVIQEPKTEPRKNVVIQSTNSNKATTNKPKDNRIVLIIIAAVVLFCWGLMIMVQKPSSSSTSSSSNGDTVSLYMGGIEILCGRTEQNYSDLIGTLVNKDDYGFKEMMTNGKAFTVDSGTKALVLHRTMSQAQVRILEGPHKNEVAWVGIETIGK